MQRQVATSFLQLSRWLPASGDLSTRHLWSVVPIDVFSAQQVLAGAARSASSWRQYAIGTSTTDETHDDFKPKYKQEPVNDVEAAIEADIASHPVFIYMKVRPKLSMFQ
jgi:hypothetical protein